MRSDCSGGYRSGGGWSGSGAEDQEDTEEAKVGLGSRVASCIISSLCVVDMLDRAPAVTEQLTNIA